MSESVDVGRLVRECATAWCTGKCVSSSNIRVETHELHYVWLFGISALCFDAVPEREPDCNCGDDFRIGT